MASSTDYNLVKHTYPGERVIFLNTQQFLIESILQWLILHTNLGDTTL